MTKLRYVLMAGALLTALPMLAVAEPSLNDGKTFYYELDQATEHLAKATKSKDCSVAGERLAKGMEVYRKGKETGTAKDGWWKKAKMSDKDRLEMAGWHKKVVSGWQSSVSGGAKACDKDERFKAAVAETKN